MKTTYIKVAVIISFLTITFPSPHVILPNGIIMLLSIIDSFYEIELNIDVLMLLISIFSLLLILLKSKLFNLTGVILQIIYICYIAKKSDFDDIIFLTTLIIYGLLVLKFLFQLFVKERLRTKV